MKFPSFEKSILKFYAVGIIPLILTYIIFEITNVYYLNFLYFTVSFCWNFTLRSPGIEERVDSLAYRFTFIKFIYHFDKLLTKPKFCETNVFLKLMMRSLAPLLFVLVVYTFTEAGNILFYLLGVVLFELIYSLALKRNYISFNN